MVHLDGSTPTGEAIADPALPTGKFNHVAFRSRGLAAMRYHLRTLKIEWAEASVPGIPLHQLFLRDPIGLKVELTYDRAEIDACGAELGLASA